MGKVEDITGQKFNRWTVISRGPNSSNRVSQWWCRCDCGNPELRLIPKSRLQGGYSKSCGCLQKEVASQKTKKYNQYDLSGEYGIGTTFNYDSYGRNEFYFDLEDYELIKDYCWYFNGRDYLQASNVHPELFDIKRVQMHQIILPSDEVSVPDHIHGELSKNDNRKSNLRLVTTSQNAMNAKVRDNNKSGVTGVRWNKKAQKYVAYIQKDGVNHHLGSFVNFDDAVKTRKEAEMKYFGEFSYKISQNM